MGPISRKTNPTDRMVYPNGLVPWLRPKHMYSPDWLQIEAKKHQEKARGGSQETATQQIQRNRPRDPNTRRPYRPCGERWLGYPFLYGLTCPGLGPLDSLDSVRKAACT